MEPFHNNPTKFNTCDHCKSAACKEKSACLLKSARGVKKNIQNLSGIFDSMIALAREDGKVIAHRSEPMRYTHKKDGRLISSEQRRPVGDDIVKKRKRKDKKAAPTPQPSRYADDLIRHKKAKKASKAAEGTPHPPTSNPRGPDKTGKIPSKTPKQPPIRVPQGAVNPMEKGATVTIKKGQKTIARSARAKIATPARAKAERVLKKYGGVNAMRVQEALDSKKPIEAAMKLLRISKKR